MRPDTRSRSDREIRNMNLSGGKEENKNASCEFFMEFSVKKSIFWSTYPLT